MDFTFEQICFFYSQVLFVPAFLYTTKRAFLKKKMGIGNGIKFFVLSPFCIYFFSLFIMAVFVLAFRPAESVARSAGEIIFLLLSVFFSYVYSKMGDSDNRVVMIYTYLCFYMMTMACNIISETPGKAVIYSLIIPSFMCFFIVRYFSRNIARIAEKAQWFQKTMLVLPLLSELLLCGRSLLLLKYAEDEVLVVYSNPIIVCTTILGYIIVVFIFLFTYMITKDIKNMQDITNKNKKLVDINAELRISDNHRKQLTIEMVKALVDTIEAKDEYTNGHSVRVALYSKMIAEKLGMSKTEAENVHMCALLHDIGKIAIPDNIINKSGVLTGEEFKSVKLHPEKGASILLGIREMPDLYVGALYHHERWDGSGYPNGLRGEEIPYIARIIAVADSYDAMTSRRSYQSPRAQEAVRTEMLRCAGTQFAPEIARIMVEIIDEDMGYSLRQEI